MGDVDKQRRFLKKLLRNEVLTDSKLEKLKPKTDELGNFVIPSRRKKLITSRFTPQQSIKNDSLRQDLERQTKISGIRKWINCCTC